MDTNTSIMYEGSAVSQYSTWELHCSWAGKDKSSKSSVSVEILTHPTGLRHSVICWMFSKKVTAFDGLARVFHVFWDYIFLFLFFVIVNKCIGFLSCWIYAAFMVSDIFNTGISCFLQMMRCTSWKHFVKASIFQTKLHQSDPKLKTPPNLHRSLLRWYNQHLDMDAGLLLVPCGVRHTQFRC